MYFVNPSLIQLLMQSHSGPGLNSSYMFLYEKCSSNKNFVLNMASYKASSASTLVSASYLVTTIPLSFL